MTKKYSGLVIGGPADRQTREHWSTHMSIPILPDGDVPLGPSAGIEKAEVADYTFIHFHFYDDARPRPIGFWVPASVRAPRRFIVETMANFYLNGGKRK